MARTNFKLVSISRLILTTGEKVGRSNIYGGVVAMELRRAWKATFLELATYFYSFSMICENCFYCRTTFSSPVFLSSCSTVLLLLLWGDFSSSKAFQIPLFPWLKLPLMLYTSISKKFGEKSDTVFENHRKSLIQHCERSELLLHFEWTKVH